MRRSSRTARITAAVILGAIGTGILLRDVAAMRWRGRWMPADLGGVGEQLLSGFRGFAEVLTIVTACILVAAFDRRRRNSIIVSLLVGQAFALIAYDSCKWLVARHRPISAVANVADMDALHVGETWLGWKPGNFNSALQSFPSGHAAAAFALAGVLSRFYPRIRWMLWMLAIGCAFSRFLHADHWPSDCMAGAALGYVASQIALLIAAPAAAKRQ